MDGSFRGRMPAAALLSACVLTGGCTDPMSRIDRRVDAAVAERSGWVGTESPVLEPPSGEIAPRSERINPRPATTNPSAETLRYETADTAGLTPDEVTDRVTTRLRDYGASAAGVGESARQLTLQEALRLAQLSAREHRNAEESYLLDAIAFLIEEHLWSPRFFNDTSLDFVSSGENGRFDPALSVINTLRATKRLPYGGEVEARWVARASEDLRSSVSGQYVQSSELVFSGAVPLLRGAGTVAREDLIQAERSLIYSAREFERFRREFFVDLASDYFDLLEVLARIQNQIGQLRSLLAFQQQRQALYEAERISKFEVEEASNRVLTAESSLANLREQYTLQVDRFKVRLGLDPSVPVQLVQVVFDLDAPSVALLEATDAAMNYRLDLQTRADQVADAQRRVDNAKNNLLPDLDVGGSVSIPTDGDTREGGVGFDQDDTTFRASVDLSLPLDRNNERLRLRSSQISYDRARRDYEQFRDNIALEARQRVRAIDLARFSLDLAERQVEINIRRQQEQEIRIDEIDTNRRLDTENDLLNALNARDSAATDLRVAVLQYLLSSGQMRVGPDGGIAPLQGMEIRTLAPGEQGEGMGGDRKPLDYAELFGPVTAPAPTPPIDPGQG